MPYTTKKSGVQMSPYKKYGTEEKAAPMMSGKMQPPALLAKCGMGRYGKKK